MGRKFIYYGSKNAAIFTFIGSKTSHVSTGSSGGSNTLFPLDTTGANLIVLMITFYGLSATPTVSDSYSNTWVPLTPQGAGAVADAASQFYYCINPTVGSSHIFTVAGTASYSTIYAQAFSSTGTPSFDQEIGTVLGIVNTGQPGSITPPSDNALFIAGGNLYNSSSNPPTVNQGFSVSDSQSISGSVNFGGSDGYLIQGTAASRNPTWSWNATSPDSSLIMATFLP